MLSRLRYLIRVRRLGGLRVGRVVRWGRRVCRVSVACLGRRETRGLPARLVPRVRRAVMAGRLMIQRFFGALMLLRRRRSRRRPLNRVTV